MGNCSDCSVFREFSGVQTSIKNLDKEDESQWEAILTERKRIDTIKNWVIAGMSSLILNLIGTVVALVMFYLKLKGSP